MERLTLQNAYDGRVPAAAGDCVGSARLLGWINEAQIRLGSKGLWHGTVAKYRLAAYGGIISMPPELATIESVAINHVPIPYHDLFYEFLEYGFGTRSRDNVGTGGGSALGGATGCYGIPEADYRGSFPVFRDLTPNTDNKKLVIVCDLAADHTAGITVTLLGYDQNGNWIRTAIGGVYSDGETIALAQAPGTATTNYFSRITDVQFSAKRSGQCWLYELDTVTSVQTMIGWYQWHEVRPSYGRWLFPSIGSPSPTSGVIPPARWQQNWTTGQIPNPALTTYNPSLVEVVGKKAFIPVVLPSDYLFIQNIPALKNEVQCVKKLEDAVSSADVQEAMAFETLALKELDDQLDSMLGSGRRIGMTIQGSLCPGGEPVPTFL